MIGVSLDGPVLAAGAMSKAAFFVENRMSRAITLARRPSAARKYMETFRRLQKLNRAFECEYGHFGCAAEPNGACTDELVRLTGVADDRDAES